MCFCRCKSDPFFQTGFFENVVGKILAVQMNRHKDTPAYESIKASLNPNLMRAFTVADINIIVVF